MEQKKRRVVTTSQTARDDGGPKLETAADATVTIAGKEIKHLISRITLEQVIDDHHLLTVRVRQTGTSSAESDFIDPKDFSGLLGESVALRIKPTGGLIKEERELSFVGLVTEVRLENSIDGLNTVVITGRSPTIALDGARKNVFHEEQSVSDLIGSTLSGHPISVGNIEGTKGTLGFCVQYRETDYDFVMRLASGSGLFAYYDGNKFHAARAHSSDQEELTWRESLGSFAVGLGTASQEFKASVYNYGQDATFSQDSKSIPATASLSELSKVAPEASKNIYSDSGYSTAIASVGDLQSLDEALGRERGQAMGRMIRCTGESNVPSVTVGRCVRVKGMAGLDGSYWVDRIVHEFDESGKYHNRFTCTPLDMSFPRVRSALKPSTELQRAEVRDNDDPEKLGRIKVKFPWSEGDTPWIRYVSIDAGDGRGWYCVPEPGDEVLVGFEFGNPALPIAIGALYNSSNRPAGDTQKDQNAAKGFVTRSGNKIVISDEGGAEEILVSTKGGDCQIVLQCSGPSINIESTGDITIKGKSISLQSQGDMKLESSGKCEIKSSACDIDGGSQVTVKGGTINLN